MFCYKCGKQLPDDALFCQYCGTSQQRTGDSISTNQQIISNPISASKELDHDAIKIYLGNILSLECVKIKYQRELPQIRYNASNIQKSYHYYQRYVYGDNLGNAQYIHLLFDGKFHLAWSNKGGSYDRYRLQDGYFHWFSWSNDSEIKHLRKVKYWEGSREYRDRFFVVLERFKAEAPVAYHDIIEANDKKLSTLQDQIDTMSVELANAENLLEQAYNINIIPSQYRHQVPVLYYLHDFLSTSRESFTTALLHLDLDEIKSKLDRIIDQQESMILQNAAMIAQNERMMKQNQMHLDQLARIEQNTSQSAQYANIAANNAAVCAWFSAANYIEAHR